MSYYHLDGNSPINTQHARTYSRDGQKVNQHEPVKREMSLILNSLSIKHGAESGVPFTIYRELSMDIVIRRGATRDASSSVYRNKGILILLDVTMQTRKHRHTCEEIARPTMDLLPKSLRRESVGTTLAQDTCPLTSAALNLPHLRWKAVVALERKDTSSSTK